MIDNLELIKPLLSFDEGYFYVLYVMTRNKDLGITVSEKAQKHRIIKEYYIESLEYLERKYEEIKKLCGVFNARAFINLNPIYFTADGALPPEQEREIEDEITKQKKPPSLPQTAQTQMKTSEAKQQLVSKIVRYDNLNSLLYEEVDEDKQEDIMQERHDLWQEILSLIYDN